ncbi:MAG: M20 family metallopeptidase [Candidatus Heimdallarchaeota archaeon]
MIQKKLLERCQEIAPDLVKLRRDIHANPELGFQEVRTSKLIAERLSRLGLEVQTNIAETGVVGLLRGGRPGKTIALRADMDALSIQEQTGAEYQSQIPGVMHACGHDAHVAMLLGAAQILQELQVEIPGNIKFIFQPAEEGPGGAAKMVEEGVLHNPDVDATIALHVDDETEVGQIKIKSGIATAAANAMRIKIQGKGGHAAYPHKSVDAIVVAAHVILALQTIVARETDPLDAVVVTIGVIEGGDRNNIIAEKVIMEGTIRTLNDVTRKATFSALQRITEQVCTAMRAECEIEILEGYPPGVNDPQLIGIFRKVAEELLGPENVKIAAVPEMGAEDFYEFGFGIPAAMFHLGIANKEKGITFPGHHPRYDIDEDALPLGVAILVASALNFLQECKD